MAGAAARLAYEGGGAPERCAGAWGTRVAQDVLQLVRGFESGSSTVG